MTAKPSCSPVALCALRNDESQRVRQVPDRPAAIINACRPDLDESQRRMERIRCRVWRVAVDFTDNALVSGFSRMLEQIAIEPACAAAPARADDATTIRST